MIARIILPLILLILLPDIYLYIKFIHKKKTCFKLFNKYIWWLPSLFLVVYAIILSLIGNFAPKNISWLTTFLIILGIIAGGKLIFSIILIISEFIYKLFARNVKKIIYIIPSIVTFSFCVLYLYGWFWGVAEIKVKKLDLKFKDLPSQFDRYKIVHVSDLHLGSFKGWRKNILKAELDSIKAQHPNKIFFTGDLQNMSPNEVYEFIPLLRAYMPNTIAVLGNHDYSSYMKLSYKKSQYQEQLLKDLVKDSLKWTLLTNSNIKLYAKPKKDSSYIVVCGGENDGLPPFPSKVNFHRMMNGINKTDFVIMLQHDPAAWKRNILTKTNAQLTLSGHTHGGQMQFFGFRPTQLIQSEDLGLYNYKGRYLYITAGLGGLASFRINMPNEITVITLHKSL